MMIQKEMERCALGIAAIYAKNDNLQEDMNSYEYPTEEPDEMLSMLDVLVDGRFEEDKKNITLLFRGSENQRLIDVKKSLEEGQVVEWKPAIKRGL